MCLCMASMWSLLFELFWAVVEHIPSTRIGKTCFGENLEDFRAGLCRPVHCRNAHSLQGTLVCNTTFKMTLSWNTENSAFQILLLLWMIDSHFTLLNIDMIFWSQEIRSTRKRRMGSTFIMRLIFVLLGRWEFLNHHSFDLDYWEILIW